MTARRRLRAVLVSLALLAGTGAVGAVATGVIGDDPPDGGHTPAGPPATASIERVSLVRSQTVPGTLGYGAATSVEHPGTGATATGTPAAPGTPGGGHLTWLPDVGALVQRGQPVYAVDERPVPLLYGATPLYRELAPGDEGQDVAVVENNLVALGYTGFTADDAYTSATADAVRAWQKALGIPETGTIGPGDAVVAPEARRVDSVTATLGRAASGPVLDWTGTARGVSVALEVQYEDLVDTGTKATVELPDGTTVDAEVTRVGSVATAAPSVGGGADGQGPQAASQDSEGATLPVELAVSDQGKLGRYQAAPVEVTFVAETREGVLAVPVNALVALREGGYAVEVVDPAASAPGSTGPDYRAVTLGMFVNGRVEISGPGITEGLTVGVPR
ncbi:MAG TPA: peptidoglycan-binding domain-containing protein [Yinghuangia sp.]|nr:peptidoglycan-binding domain-containing protein [Yinghuangia sp.]